MLFLILLSLFFGLESNDRYQQSFECFGVNNTSPSVCSGHGSCLHPNDCDCDDGYFSKDCSLYYCNRILYNSSEACDGHGECYGADLCSCDSGYSHQFCDYFYCYGKNVFDTFVCSGHGKCVDSNRCSCKSEEEHYYYEGPNCNITIFACFGVNNTEPNVCSSHGVCLAYDLCNCSSENYFGRECGYWTCFDVLFNESSKVCCHGNGVCSSPDTCVCKDGYEGIDCCSMKNKSDDHHDHDDHKYGEVPNWVGDILLPVAMGLLFCCLFSIFILFISVTFFIYSIRCCSRYFKLGDDEDGNKNGMVRVVGHPNSSKPTSIASSTSLKILKRSKYSDMDDDVPNSPSSSMNDFDEDHFF